MGPYQLEIFKTVVEKKSFSAAAKALFISQPAVSMHIRALEEYYKTKLFDRANQQITLTETGRILYDYAVKVLNLLNQAEKEISSYTGQIVGPLDIGASFTVGEYVVPKLLGIFNKLNPGVKASLRVTNTEHIVKLVSRQKLDLGFVEHSLVEHSVDARNLIVNPIMQDELQVVFSPEHPWANRKTITIQELKDMPLVLREHGSGTRRMAEERLEEAGFDLDQLNVIMELGSTEAVKEAVEAGFGITIISRWAIQKELKLGTLLSARIEDVNMSRNFYLIYHKDKFKPLVVEKFIEFLISYCKEYS